jgi:hypothetical protein
MAKSKLDKLCTDCSADLDTASKQSEASGLKGVAAPKGFEWISIITLLLPLLTEWLGGSCLARQGAKNVQELVKSNGLWSKVAMSQCCRQLKKDEGIDLNREQRDAVSNVLAVKASKGELEPVLDEVNDAFNIDSIWG